MKLLFSNGFNHICAVEAASIVVKPVIESPKDLYYVVVRDFNRSEYTVNGMMGCRFDKKEANQVVKKLYETGCFMEGCAKENYE